MKIRLKCDPALIDLLPRPIPARDGLPGWLKSMPPTAFSETHGQSVRTVKQCPPFIDAMTHGFLMPLACDVTVSGGRFSWHWPLPQPAAEQHPRSPLSFHVAAQATGSPLHRDDQALIKFNSYWTIELPPGYSLFATHPVNRADLPFRTLTGLVDADRFHQVGILFPAAWTDPDFEGVLPAGTPVAQCFAVAREALELACEPMTAEETALYDATANALLSEPGVYRKTYRAKRPAGQEAAASEPSSSK